MKNWLKNNILKLLANFFIWVVPLVMVLILTFGGTQEQTSLKFKISLWGIVVAVIYLLVFYKKLRKELDRAKTIQIAKLGYVKFWIRLIEMITYLLPYGIVLVLFIGLKGVYESVYSDLIIFIIMTMASGLFGYILLMIDTKQKSANIKE